MHCSSIYVDDHKVFVVLAVNFILLLVTIHNHLVDIGSLGSLILINVLNVFRTAVTHHRRRCRSERRLDLLSPLFHLLTYWMSLMLQALQILIQSLVELGGHLVVTSVAYD